MTARRLLNEWIDSSATGSTGFSGSLASSFCRFAPLFFRDARVDGPDGS